MMESFRHIEFKQAVKVKPAEAYRAFTYAVLLRDWFCDNAYTVPRVGGQYLLTWNSGYYASGEYIALEPSKLIQMSWQGRSEPLQTMVQVSFEPDPSAGEESTVITLRHGKIPINGGAEWERITSEYKHGWETGFENLASVIENGIDLRIYRRPMLGIYLDEFNEKYAAQLGVPVKEGIRVAGTLDGLGAQKAGLIKDDVIIRLNNKPVNEYQLFLETLKPFKAGDTVPLEYYRGANLIQCDLLLSARPKPEFPATPLELAERARKDYDQGNVELEAFIREINEDAASKKPSPDEWSAKEALAHLIATERDFHTWLSNMINDNFVPDSLEYSSNVNGRMDMFTAVYPTLAELMAALKLSQAETVEFLLRLPPEFVARKHYYYRVCNWEQPILEHIREHLVQMKAAVGVPA